jgi:putative DNA primase/helicase
VTAAEIADALGGGRRGGGGWWSCRCPVHDDRSPSLSLCDGDRGLIVKCWAGCDPRDVLAELRRRGLAGGGKPYFSTPARRVTTGDDLAGRIEAALRLWNAAQEPRGGLLARYLTGRRIHDTPAGFVALGTAMLAQRGGSLPAGDGRGDR